MTTIHVTNVVNVEATLNAWFQTELAAITLPSWLSTYNFVALMPETGINPPAVSVAHVPISTRRLWQLNDSARAGALLMVDLWVTRANQNWQAQLRTLAAMVNEVFAGNQTVVLNDYWTNPASPTAQQFKIDLGSLEGRSVSPDPNPDIERTSYSIRYDWTVRSNR